MVEVKQPLNLNNLRKDEILWIFNHYCKHGHRYTEHPQCYIQEQKTSEKICILDIESGGSLTADFGYLFSYSIKPLHGEIISNVITPKEVRSKSRDRRLMLDFCKDIRPFDIIVTYYGSDKTNRHDMPFLRTRAVKWDIETFPIQKEKQLIDVYDIIKMKFKLARRRQTDACRLFNIKFSDHPVNPQIWQDALAGMQDALDYILLHNKEDVMALEGLFLKVIRYKNSRINI